MGCHLLLPEKELKSLTLPNDYIVITVSFDCFPLLLPFSDYVYLLNSSTKDRQRT